MRSLFARALALALLFGVGLATIAPPTFAQVGLEDRVRDTTTTSGTGTYTLSGSAPTGSVAFSSAFATGVTVRYFVTDGGAHWESVTGVYTTAGNTLSRVVIETSSNSNNAVSWPDNTAKTVFVSPSARDLAYQLPTYLGTSGGSANAQTLIPSVVLRAYLIGHNIRFKAGFTNTGATTLVVSGLAGRNIFKQTASGPAALTGGEIQANQILNLIDDGTQYQIISAGPLSGVLGAGYSLIECKVASGSSTLDFVTGISSTNDQYDFRITNIVPATNATDYAVQVSKDAGTNWITTSSYVNARQGTSEAGSAFAAGGSTDAGIILFTPVSNSAAGGVSGVVSLSGPSGTTNAKRFQSRLGVLSSDTHFYTVHGAHYYGADTNAINGVRFKFSSGNISTGKICLYAGALQ